MTQYHIGLMGAHGTGKSTYARRLWAWAQDNFAGGAALIHEVARKCPYQINRATTADAQRWIFHRQLWEELDALRRPVAWVICDRTVMDSLIYAEVAGLDEVVDACMPEALAWMERYTHLLWFRPVAGRLVHDGLRDPDPMFQDQVDQVFQAWIAAYGLSVMEVSEQCSNVPLTDSLGIPHPRNGN